MGDYYPGPGTFGVDTFGFSSNKILGPDTTAFIVGSTAVTPPASMDDVTYLDTGNGVALQQAMMDASAYGGGTVIIRGTVFVDLNLPGAPPYLTIPYNVRVGDPSGLFSGLNIRFRTSGIIDQLRITGTLSGAFINIPAPTEAMTADLTDAAVVAVGNGAGIMENVFILANGEDYTVTEANWQPMRTVVSINPNTQGTQVSVYDCPPLGYLLGDTQQCCSAARTGVVLS